MSNTKSAPLKTGDKFNNWEVIDPSVPTPCHIKNKRPFAKCKCLDCGKEQAVNIYDMVKGSTKNCGCTRKKDVIGKTFGLWTVISRSHFDQNTYYNCKCECGKTAIIPLQTLTSGGSKSCGCGFKITTEKEAKQKAVIEVFVRNKNVNRHYGNGNLPVGLCSLLIQLPCFYCRAVGVNEQSFDTTESSEFVKINSRLKYNGLDRFSNKISKTHDMNNTVPACPQCNFFKLDRNYEDMIENIPKLNPNFIPLTLNNIDTVRKEIKLLNEGKIQATYTKCSTDLGKLYSSDFNSKIGKFISHRKEERYKNIPMTLSVEEIAELKLAQCVYCGKKPKLSSMELNEIDRIDPGMSYESSNCTTACRPCNSAKSTLTLEQFKDWIIRLQSNFINLPKTENEVIELINIGYFIDQAKKLRVGDYFDYLK